MTQTKLKGLTADEIQGIERKKKADEFLVDVQDDEVEYLVDIPDPETFELKVPMKVRGVEYRTLTIRPLRGEDFPKFAASEKAGIDINVLTFCIITDTPYAVIKRLSAVDMAELGQRAERFLALGSLVEGGETVDGQTSDSGPSS